MRGDSIGGAAGPTTRELLAGDLQRVAIVAGTVMMTVGLAVVALGYLACCLADCATLRRRLRRGYLSVSPRSGPFLMWITAERLDQHLDGEED